MHKFLYEMHNKILIFAELKYFEFISTFNSYIVIDIKKIIYIFKLLFFELL